MPHLTSPQGVQVKVGRQLTTIHNGAVLVGLRTTSEQVEGVSDGETVWSQQVLIRAEIGNSAIANQLAADCCI